MSEEIDEELVKEYQENIDQGIRSGVGTVDVVLEKLRQSVERNNRRPEEALRKVRHLEALKVAAVRYRTSQGKVEYFRKPAIRGSNNREKWYVGPQEGAATWKGMVELLVERGRSTDVIDEVDRVSTGVLSLMDRPSKAEFKTLGLVVGHVQSGKTQGMAALLAKAASTEYKFFLILAGMTDALRKQTQDRLQKDLVDVNPGHWHYWTTSDADFTESTNTGFQFEPGRAQLAVVKKNGAVLRRFLAKLENSTEAVRRNVSFVIIDDECDQASVNSHKYESQMTAINGLIRKTIAYLPRVAYVGFTATPFANVLISPIVEQGKLPDLYPKDFIFPMTAPADYFGAERLFGRSALGIEGYESEKDGLDMIRLVPEEEVGSLRPASRKALDEFEFEVTEQLEKAVGYFVLCVAARDIRGQQESHSSMLVHLTFLTSVHSAIEAALKRHLNMLREAWAVRRQSLHSKLARTWAEEHHKVPSGDFGLMPLDFDEVFNKVGDVLKQIEIKVENSTSSSRLDYSAGIPRRYIVVGGNVLARGLTVEGLIVSFFLRTSNQYDTLMQMGRWFGYRKGYEDLPRIWMEDDLRQDFRDLAAVEAEMRMAMSVYHDQNVTPEQFAVKIKQIPGMAITAKNKMRHAKTCEVSFGGTHQQTIRFCRDEDWLKHNWGEGSRFIDRIRDRKREQSGARGCTVFDAVPVEHIIHFLQAYRIHPSLAHMDSMKMCEYISRSLSSGRLQYKSWNVAVIGVEGNPRSRLELGFLGRVEANTRSSLNSESIDADIKALMSRGDLLVDLEGGKADSWEQAKQLRESSGSPPLLLLYPIDPDSQPRDQGGDRQALKAPFDVLGIGVVFPAITGEADYVSVVLPDVEPDSDDVDPAQFAELDDAAEIG